MTEVRVAVLGGVVGVLVLVVVLELIRRRRLGERYALLWIATALVVIVLALWESALQAMARAVGVSYPPALFAIASIFIVLVLLHYSTVISRLMDRTTRLAQELAILEERVREAESAVRATTDVSSAEGSEGHSR